MSDDDPLGIAGATSLFVVAVAPGTPAVQFPSADTKDVVVLVLSGGLEEKACCCCCCFDRAVVDTMAVPAAVVNPLLEWTGDWRLPSALLLIATYGFEALFPVYGFRVVCDGMVLGLSLREEDKGPCW